MLLMNFPARVAGNQKLNAFEQGNKMGILLYWRQDLDLMFKNPSVVMFL